MLLSFYAATLFAFTAGYKEQPFSLSSMLLSIQVNQIHSKMEDLGQFASTTHRLLYISL